MPSCGWPTVGTNFSVVPNISEKFVPGGTNFRGVQIKRDTPINHCQLIQDHRRDCTKSNLSYWLSKSNVNLVLANFTE